MAIEAFPSLDEADEYGLLALGGDLEPESLLLAYRSGIFPWPLSPELLTWFSPPRRAVLYLNEVHISKSLAKLERRKSHDIRVDFDFEAVIRNCASSSQRKGKTWITNDIMDAYCELHRLGYAHSIEYYEEDSLLGGLYGVSIGGMFAGESMFHKKANASKLCLMFLVQRLAQKGVSWIDCQQLTPLLRSFGAREIERAEFVAQLNLAVSRKIDLFRD